jgi:predicted nucleic-acid-binding protein
MRAVDTNVLIRLLVRDDAGQVRAAEQFTASGAWISLLTLAESAWILETNYSRTPAQIAGAIEYLLAHSQFVVQDSDVVAAALHAFKSCPSTEFPDHLSLEIARKAGHVPLGTFDRHFARSADTVRLSV